MRTSGGGYDKLMVLLPVGVVLAFAVVYMGGPAPLLEILDHRLANIFTSVYEWARNVL